MSTARVRLGVLVSGGGSNLQALLDACAREDFPAEVACVVSNVPTAYALERARAAGVPAVVVDHKAHASKAAFEAAILEALGATGVQWVCLAGFMRLLSADFLGRFAGRVLNVHPSLLPSFPGLHAQRQALERGVKVAGCTVHFVDAGTDTGPIIGQAAVPVLPDDDEKSLSARILVEEHRLYPLAVRLAVTGQVTLDGVRTRVAAAPSTGELALRSPGATK
ncbi:formyltetrahydrofolate-dependent phosphoribosylglycinamide formyltransferase [Myxococcus fulvus]|uniref:Phosphoribosylglycinamide formyltransferase n=1 Tax=Myxococcus fulvus TaxID=33 RepID=A0A511T300_MYXFU|nr:phosphoribosylglycinamide formyltransferase [Myxococcus fulvus]GEN08535.1 phosphoribosylglycinamide formyltransferase [Myxococcus fulvus]SEU30908.1 formyltetrahydrofolate-dependent phosphoribosylglycinamide formyltransferase [Myxococcus fulvus]